VFVGGRLNFPYIRRAVVSTPRGRCGPCYGLSDTYDIIGAVHLQVFSAKKIVKLIPKVSSIVDAKVAFSLKGWI